MNYLVAEWISDFKDAVDANGLPWIEPSVPVGTSHLSWWVGTRTLDVFLDGPRPEYVRSWGRSVITEMDDGAFTWMSQALVLWCWLHDLSDLQVLAAQGKHQ